MQIPRKTKLGIAATVAGWLAALPLAALAESPGRLHMFLDGASIESSQNTKLVVQQPTRLGRPVIRGDFTWQANPYTYGSVIFDERERTYKAWYESLNPLPKPEATTVLYATSSDGRNWNYPRLGLVDFKGSKENNVLFLGAGFSHICSPSVIKDDRDPDPARRYKLIYWDLSGPETYGDGGMFTGVSADGIRWTRTSKPVLYAEQHERSISDVMDLVQDPATGKYIVYAKGWADPFPSHRQIVRAESDDFVIWSRPEPVLRHAHDDDDPQSYGMPVFAYEGLFIGLPRSYKKPGDDTIDVRLAVSRDSKSWETVADGQTFMSLGPRGAWDSGMIFTAPPIVRGDAIEIFYGGWNGPHGGRRRASIGLATLPVGRFAALTAPKGLGVVTMRTLTLDGDQVLLNADASHGAIRAAILDENGTAIDGFQLDAASPISIDALDVPLRWLKSGDTLTALKGQKIRLRFEIRGDARLYAFRVVDSARQDERR